MAVLNTMTFITDDKVGTRSTQSFMKTWTYDTCKYSYSPLHCQLTQILLEFTWYLTFDLYLTNY